MTCEIYQRQMLDARLLTGDDLKVFETHLAKCGDCRRDHEIFIQMDDVMLARPLKQPATDFTLQVLQRVAKPEVVQTHKSVFGSRVAFVASMIALWAGIRGWMSQESVDLERVLLQVRLPVEAAINPILDRFESVVDPSAILALGGLEMGLVMGLLVVTWGLFLSLSD